MWFRKDKKFQCYNPTTQKYEWCNGITQSRINFIDIRPDINSPKWQIHFDMDEDFYNFEVYSKEEGMELLKEIQFVKLIDTHYLETKLEYIRGR